jgi:dethiobiotin synthetase
MKPLIVAGTDTGVGKTVTAAMLTLALDAVYWKPIQSGTQEDTDGATLAALTGLAGERFRPERYVLSRPLSPHRAAELDGVEIRPEALDLPDDVPAGGWLVIEGAGGLLVPINRSMLQIDLFQRWQAPIVLCARTGLGTINHSLLSIEALKRRGMALLGVVFIGEPNPDSERTIVEFGRTLRLGRLPPLKTLAPAELIDAFHRNFNREDFEAAYRR